eukprot:CAMPEP_0181178118 /NCGR_PEP_ID=MMETSP1096-20121128/5544_1 /TAXON_ID=156174 ORGANISM="Chrysochromulina ericina, Strain CCMP281" /NCGR_SAMPLE_ID=MMETSP1096 /ASSEMBLY_ACC=CAM_ASM_000453 /LENGTH=60 /DNA_ID=CAMNT_0023266355 /DNA_START=306 /DNA_END=488 /DNA_ORIENTATION=-
MASSKLFRRSCTLFRQSAPLGTEDGYIPQPSSGAESALAPAPFDTVAMMSSSSSSTAHDK